MDAQDGVASLSLPPSPVRRDPSTLPDRYDDMTYTQEELEAFPMVADLICVAGDIIFPLYEQADRKANKRQGQHRKLTLLAAVGGTISMLLSLIGLSALAGELLPWIELGLLLLSLAAIFLGVFAAAAPGWLLERHRAEHCRLQKFKFLIDPELWTGDPVRREARIQKLRDDVEGIAEIKQEELDTWIEREFITTAPTGWSEQMMTDGSLQDLVGYYWRNRLLSQLGYFRKRKDSFSRREAILKVLPTILFITSVALALANSAYVYAVSYGVVRSNFGIGQTEEITPGYAADDHAAPAASTEHGAVVNTEHGAVASAEHGAVASAEHGEGEHGPDATSRLLTVTMASLAIIATGVRTVRGASEYGRNSSRYAAKYEMLHSVEERLEEGPATLAILPAFWHAEQSLEGDHRDWLRLMREAEWFG